MGRVWVISKVRILGIVTLGAAFVLSLTVAARADCDDAVRSYNSAISDYESAVSSHQLYCRR
jgi:hypothetical protein